MTQAQKLEITLKNLQKVVDELPKLAEKIPEIITDFNMALFGVYDRCQINEIQNRCNTFGCLLGNTARLFPIKEDYFMSIAKQFDYDIFCNDIFPYIIMKHDYDDWDFIFNANWRYFQPTFHQAIDRVKFFIACKGKLPEWEYQKESFFTTHSDYLNSLKQ